MPIGTFLPFSTLFENAVLKRNVNHLFGILESPRFLNSDDFLDFLLFQKIPCNILAPEAVRNLRRPVGQGDKKICYRPRSAQPWATPAAEAG